MKTMLILVIQLKNAVVPNANPVTPCCENIVAMLLCGRTFQKRCVNTAWSMKGPKECQNYDGDFAASERQFKDQSRIFSKHLLFRSIFLVKKLLENGLFTPLPQEIFSALYVFCLVTSTLQQSFQVLDSSRLIDHENSAAHHSLK